MVSTLLISKHHRWLNLTSRLSHLAVLQPLLFHKHIYSTNSLLSLVVTERSFMTTLRELVWEGLNFEVVERMEGKDTCDLESFDFFKNAIKSDKTVVRQARMKKDANIDTHDQPRALPQLSPQLSSLLPRSHWILPDCYYQSWRPSNWVVGWKTHCERKTVDEGQRTSRTLPVTQGISPSLCIRRSEENLGDEGCTSWNKATGNSEPKYLRFPFRLPLQCFLYPLPSRCYLLNQK